MGGIAIRDDVPSGLNSQLWQIKAGQPYKRNAGTILFAGNNVNDPVNIKTYQKFNNLSMITACAQPPQNWGSVVPNNNTGTGWIQQGASGSITSIGQSGNYCLITKTSNGFTVGTQIQIQNCSTVGYNVIHTVKAILNANAFQTDVVYLGNASNAGTFSVCSGNFATQVRKQYVASLVTTKLAGISNNAMFMMGAANVAAYNAANQSYGVQINSFDYFSGVPTYGPQWGVANYFWNITGGTTLTTEPHPTLAVPGFLVFTPGALIPSKKNYNAKTV